MARWVRSYEKTKSKKNSQQGKTTMKITKEKLKQIIKEELGRFEEVNMGGEDPPTMGDIKFGREQQYEMYDETTEILRNLINKMQMKFNVSQDDALDALAIMLDRMEQEPLKTEPLKESVAVDVVTEDGHQDVPSARRKMKTIIEDAGQMLQALEQLPGDSSLPSWWTNKLAVSAAKLNAMRDYLLVPAE